MSRTTSILLAAATSLALALLPATAGAEYFIPEGNSAVNQYTEGIPTGGGERDSKGSGDKEVRPAQAIGAKNTKKLEQAGGREGREAAEAVAETAPPPVLIEEPAPAPEAAGGEARGNADRGTKTGKKRGGSKAKPAANGESEAVTAPAPPPGDGPGGSGGGGAILAAATGASSGGTGLLLPLVIVAAIAWGLGYTWRQRTTRHTASANP